MFTYRKKKSIHQLAMRFSDGGAQPPADPTPSPDPAPEPTPEPAKDPTPDPAPAPDMSKLQRKLEAAEKALELERSAHSKLKREHMTDEQRRAEQDAEIEETKKTYHRQLNAITAEKMCVKAGLSSDEYDALINLVVSEDADKTEEIMQAVLDLLQIREAAAEKGGAEKRLKNTPILPAGGSNDLPTDGVKLAASLGKQAAQTNTASNDVLKHYLGG